MPRSVASLPHPSAEVVHPISNKLVLTREWWRKLSEMADRIPVTGTATFAAAATVAVTFVTPEISTDYQILVEANADRNYWPSSKTVTGFTLNASASNSDTILWTLVRT